jgi:hypothetical protein
MWLLNIFQGLTPQHSTWISNDLGRLSIKLLSLNILPKLSILFVPTSFKKGSGNLHRTKLTIYFCTTICIKNILHRRACEWKDRVKRSSKKNLMLVWYQWVPNKEK